MLPEALHVAREHCDYCAMAGMSPIDVLASAGIRIGKYHVPSWDLVERHLAREWLDMMSEEWREVA